MKLIRELLNEHIEQLDESFKNLSSMKLGKMLFMLKQHFRSRGGTKGRPEELYSLPAESKSIQHEFGSESVPEELGVFKQASKFFKMFDTYSAIALYHNSTPICFAISGDGTTASSNIQLAWDFSSVFDKLSEETKNALKWLTIYNHFNEYVRLKSDRRTSFDYEKKNDEYTHIRSSIKFFEKYGGVKNFINKDKELLPRDKWPEDAQKDEYARHISRYDVEYSLRYEVDLNKLNMYGVVIKGREFKPLITSLFNDLGPLTAIAVASDSKKPLLRASRNNNIPAPTGELDENQIAAFKKDLVARLTAYKNKKLNPELETKEDVIKFIMNLTNSGKKFRIGGKTYLFNASDIERDIGKISLKSLIKGQEFVLHLDADRKEKGSEDDYRGITIAFRMKDGSITPLTIVYYNANGNRVEEKF